MSQSFRDKSSSPSKWYAAIPLFIASTTYAVGTFQFGTAYATHLGELMQLEFLAMHAGAFLGFLLFWAPSTRGGRAARAVGILMFSALYLLGAYGEMGWLGAVEFSLLIGLTYAGLIIPDRSAARLARVAEVGVRWLFTLVAFMIVGGIAGTPSDVGTWPEHRSVLIFGAFYFLVLGLMELTGLYGFVRCVATNHFQSEPI